MTVYPFALDSDETIIRLDDNISELGTEAINQLRSAVFAIEEELGINPSGTLTSVTDRIGVSINLNGTLKASALTSVGLATLPIDDAQVGSGAGIQETKLALDYTTADLNAQLTANTGTLNSLAAFATITNTNLLLHISGAVLLSDGSTAGRHVSSQIDLNDVPFDSRDPSFIWDGLIDKDGNTRTATTVAEALLQINDDFVAHQNDQTGDAHFATGISIDTTKFLTIPKSADTVQKAIDAIDEADALVIKQHQANQHSNGIPKEARSSVPGNVDGYSFNIIPETEASTFLIRAPATSPVDNNTTGDDIISFNPDNTGFLFDEKFAKVKVGDVLRINYGSGVEGVFNVESKRHLPGVEWIVRINGVNLANADGYTAIARIDRRSFDTNKFGVLAIAAANNDIYPNIPPSLIVGNPKGGSALGLAFDPTQLDSTHYNLYLVIYPTGDPSDTVARLPAIDVTGDAGISPGKYTIYSVVQTVNDAFRSGGYNYRFIAYSYNGEFGIMLSDTVSDASFSIISGSISAGTLVPGVYVNNVVGDASDGRDALGFGVSKSGLASPVFSASYDSALGAASLPTVVLPPLEKRTYAVNGISRDNFAETYATTNGYWDGYISDRTAVGATTVEITYQIEGNLARAELKPGRTILVQPSIDRGDVLFSEVDYGRFFIKEVNFQACCATDPDITFITVINGLHATASPIGSTGVPDLPVRLYFGEDSVSFNASNVIDSVNGNDYSRYHEVYVNEDGETFSHERARLPIQAETVSELNTDETFKIREVSPKLKGFLDDLSSDLNRYVRFYVLNYDSVSGEYDGYIGRRTPSTDDIVDFGRVTTGRKNVPARFYDSSDVDYIEIEYIEPNQYPGTVIMSTNDPRYVDIEVFDTLATNQENLLLAGCTLASNRVTCVTDLREFGNVSEIDFTDSARSFIEAGERHLHVNGIIAGFTYKGEDVSLPGTLAFNGGIALVNGHMSTLNAQSVSIPEIVQDTGAGQTATLNWGVCVNDKDLLEVLPITPTKQHFFGRRLADSDNYYIPSVTFDELTNDRKDLVLLYIANVTIASITVNSVVDARNNIRNQTGNIDLTISDSEDASSFTSFEQIITWCENTDSNNVTVKINGPLTISQEVDLTSISNLTLEGAGGTVTINSQNGLIVKNGITIKNISFVYNALVTAVANNNSHLDLGVACINMINNSYDCIIEGCNFSQGVSGERAPYIAQFADGSAFSTAQNIKITGNKFEESSNGLNCSVGFHWTHVDDNRGMLLNVSIDDNIMDGQGSILIVSSDESIASFLLKDVSIFNNTMINGIIGYAANTEPFAGASQIAGLGLTISNNNCYAILHCDESGRYTTTAAYFTGTETISNNTCNYISLVVRNSPSNNNSSTTIDNNKLWAGVLSASFNMSFNAGISVAGQTSHSTIHITNNKIRKTDSTVYQIGISSGYDSIITGNGVHSSFTTIGISGGGYIAGNYISRDQTIVSYIIMGSGLCVDNTLDQTTTDGTDIDTISYDSNSATVARNVNHVKEVNINMIHGAWSQINLDRIYNINPTTKDGLRLIEGIESLNIWNIRFNYQTSTTGAQTTWGTLPLSSIIPQGAKIVGATIDWSTSGTDGWDSGRIRFKLAGKNTDIDLLPFPDITGASTSGTITNSSTTFEVFEDQVSLQLKLDNIEKSSGVVGGTISLQIYIKFTH